MGSQTAPKVIDDLVDPTKAIVKKGALEADEIVGEATKRSSVIDDIMDAELVQKANREKMDPRLAALLGGAGLGAAGVAMMGGDEPPQPPMAKTMEAPAPKEEEFPYDLMDAGAQAEALSMPKAAPSIKKSEPVVEKPSTVTPSEIKDISDLDRLKEAQEKDQNQAMMLGLLRGANQIGAGLAMTQADQSAVDALEKQVGSRERNVKSQISAKDDIQKIEKARLDIDDENKLRDANSNISKTARELAQRLGIATGKEVSAKQLQDAGLNLSTLLSTQIAADSRREMFALQKDQLKNQKEMQNQRKTQESVDKLVSQAYKSKDFEAYNASKDAITSIQAAIESGDKTASGTAFMQFAKIAQGDNSVVRDGDMAVLAGRFNYTSPSEMISKLAAKAKGGNFNEQELKQMQVVAERARQIKGERVQKLLSPALARAERAGLELNETIDPSVVEEFSSLGSKQSAQKSQFSPKEEMGIQAVMDKNGVSREQAISALRKAGKLK